MHYIYISADYMAPVMKGITDKNCEILQLFDAWNAAYQAIILMSKQERLNNSKEIELLDDAGEKLCKKLLEGLDGDGKLEYFSEGRLEKLFWLEKKGGKIKKTSL